MTKRFRLAPLYFVAALALACGDDTDPVEASASGTETASSTGETTVSTTVSASVSESNSGTSESDTNETSVDDTTTDAVDTDGGRCGDGEIDDDEQCDGRDLGGASCESLGVGRGVLSCAGDCTFDTSLCEDDAGDCCEANGSPSCEDVTCESIVCAADASCCDTEWTQSCADLATASCPICGELGEGDCCATNASPGCADLTCQQIVCASDPACCTNVWSQACADAAAASCAVCDGGGQGSCCEAQATPGCEDVTCQQIVCASDPFCCSDEWDSLCVGAAEQSCVVCDGGGSGDCCDSNGSPGCDDTTCQQIVCASDPFCCDTEWDQLCVDAASADCVVCGGGGAGDCCNANGSPGCDDVTCQQIVCASDPFCCSNEWDQLCAAAASEDCVVCGGGGAGDCCAPNGSAGCDDVTCQQIVCASDPFCCSNEWDQLCADAADQDCVVCGGGGTGNCCAANGTPGCDDTTCQQIVCASDPFCCSTAWDQLCADQAADSCATCGGGGDGSCCVANGTPGCQAGGCEQIVCATDPFCCATSWDQLCADGAANLCAVCGGGGQGDCCAANGTPGCQNAACESIVCAVDPFCCTNTWDGLCAGAANADCPVCV